MASSECSNCEEVFLNEQLYRCRTCLDQEQDIAIAVELFCDTCVTALHLKKGHGISDSKDHEPVVCSSHKSICTEYCKTCEVLLCTKCLRDHRQHETSTIDEKASEIKGEIHAMLTDLEMKEKPLRGRKEENAEVLRKNEETVQKMRDFVESEMERLKNLFLQTLDEILANESLSEIQLVIDDLVELQQKCRNQLNLSNDSLVVKASELKEERKLWEEKFDDQTCSATKARVDNTESLRLEFERLREKIGELIETTERDFKSQPKYHVSYGSLRNLYQVNVMAEKRIINVSKIDTSNLRHKISTTETTELTLNSQVTHVFPVCYCETGTHFILFLFANKTALKYNVSKGTVTAFNYPDVGLFLWPYIMKHGSDPDWSFWSPEDNELKFSHVAEMGVSLSSCPEVRMSSFSSPFLFFITNNLNIVLANVDGKSLETIPTSVHQLNSIDSVSGNNSKLILWCAAVKTVTIITKKDNQWINVGNVSWHKESEIFNATIAGTNYRLMPVVKETNSGCTEEYPVYAYSC